MLVESLAPILLVGNVTDAVSYQRLGFRLDEILDWTRYLMDNPLRVASDATAATVSVAIGRRPR